MSSRGELEGNRPARSIARKTQPGLQLERIDLDRLRPLHSSRYPACPSIRDKSGSPPPDHPACGYPRFRESQLPQIAESFPLSADGYAVDISDAIGEEPQRTRGRDGPGPAAGRSPRRHYAEFAKGSRPCAIRLVQPREQVTRHVDLTPHLDARRCCQRDAGSTGMRNGTLRMVRTLAVMSSPTRPSPRSRPAPAALPHR